MQTILRLFPLRVILITSIFLLLTLDVLSFYGIYTNTFYFLKFDNYIFPVLSIVHFIYLYSIWFKIKVNEPGDLQMKNVEYILYFIYLIYIFKFIESIYKLATYTDFEDHFIPETFIPIGVTLVVLYFLLLVITVITFFFRLNKISSYNFDDINNHSDHW
ncbi:hypothetical protein [Cellulophaga sp. HaHaR_3_176]|uniref:hypothetical protein n=1 Tax=Cellulophaga sp. HaHaR_3_176 TaxID=1942464 RepID=UPI001C1F2F78|nr:hypothetical protein [Cellulophaga sp. HaHaR_3_176]